MPITLFPNLHCLLNPNRRNLIIYNPNLSLALLTHAILPRPNNSPSLLFLPKANHLARFGYSILLYTAFTQSPRSSTSHSPPFRYHRLIGHPDAASSFNLRLFTTHFFLPLPLARNFSRPPRDVSTYLLPFTLRSLHCSSWASQTNAQMRCQLGRVLDIRECTMQAMRFVDGTR